MDEEIFIADFRYGDEYAFKKIFDQFNIRLCYLASKLLPSTISPEDIVQDIFVKLWEKRNDFQSISAIKAFLYISVKNKCLNHIKHYKVQQKYQSLQNNDLEEDTIMNHIVESEVLERVYYAIKQLPKRCQSVMYLSYFEGMKNTEVASNLKVSVNTIKTQKKRGLALLRLTLNYRTLLIFFFKIFILSYLFSINS